MERKDLKKEYIDYIRREEEDFLSEMDRNKKALIEFYHTEEGESLSSDMLEVKLEQIEEEAYADIDKLYEKAIDRGLTSADMPELLRIEEERRFEEAFREAQENE